MDKLNALEKDMAEVFNRHGIDSLTKIPDYILAEYVTVVIGALKHANIKLAQHENKKK